MQRNIAGLPGHLHDWDEAQHPEGREGLNSLSRPHRPHRPRQSASTKRQPSWLFAYWGLDAV